MPGEFRADPLIKPSVIRRQQLAVFLLIQKPW
jgi:hypothetical protein